MASQSTGIQQLLKAEKQAAEKVSEARKRMISSLFCFHKKNRYKSTKLGSISFTFLCCQVDNDIERYEITV